MTLLMRFIHHFVISLIFWLICLGSPAWADSPWLRVKNVKGEPLASANVEVTPMYVYGKAKLFSTDGLGEVKTPRQAYEGKDDFVIVRHEGLATQGVCHEKLSSRAGDNKPLEIEMAPGAALSGNIQTKGVVSPTKAQIWVGMSVPGEGHTHVYPFMDKISVSSSGEFEIKNQGAGRIKLWCEGDGVTSLVATSVKHDDKKKTEHVVVEVVPSRKGRLEFMSVGEESLDGLSFKMAFHSKALKEWSKCKKSSRRDRWCDERGHWQGQIPLKGFYSISVEDGRFEKESLMNIPVKELLKKVELKPLQALKGEVISGLDQTPIAEAEVEMKYRRKGKTYTSTSTSRSDAKGGFVFRNENLSKLESLRAWANGFKPKKLTQIDILKHQVIELQRGEDYRFRFLQPVPYSEPAILSDFAIKGSWESKTGSHFDFKERTDAQGVLKLGGLEDGAKINFRIDGYVEVKTMADGSNIKDVLLEPSAIFYAVIKDERGKAITRNVSFRMNQKYLKDKYIKKQSRHEVSGLGAGEHNIKVQCHGYETQTVNVTTKVGEAAVVELTLKASPYLLIELQGLEGEHPEKISYKLRQDQRGSSSGSLRQHKDGSVKGQGGKNIVRYKLIHQNLWNYHELIVTVDGYVPSIVSLSEKMDPVLVVPLKKGLELSAEVVNQNGSGVGEADVRLTSKDGKDLRFKSDESGTAKLRGLQVGTYQVEIKNDAYVTLKTQLDVVDAHVRPRWVMSKGSALSARVLKDGNPVDDLEVKLFRANEWGHYSDYFDGRSHRVKSDAQGRVKFLGLGKGSYQMKARSTEHGMVDSKVIVLNGEETPDPIDLLLQQGAQLSGRVVDEKGQGVDEVGLYVYASMGGGEHQNVSSGADGRFTFKNLKDKLGYQLQLSDERWEMKEKGPMMVSAGREDLEVVVKPMSVLRLKLLTPEGEPFRVRSGVEFYLLHEQNQYRRKIRNSDVVSDHWSISRKDLMIHHNPYMSQRYALEAVVDGYNPAKTEFMKDDDLVAVEHVLQLKPEQSLSFKVRNELGEALSRVRVTSDQQKGRPAVLSDEKGVVVLKGVSKGVLTVWFETKGYAKESIEMSYDPVVAASEREVVLKKGGSIVGTIYDARGDLAVGFSINLQEKSSEGMLHRAQTTSDKSGAFRFDHLKAGTYSLRFSEDKGVWNNEQEATEVEVVDAQDTVVELREKQVKDAGSLTLSIAEDLEGKFNMAMVVSVGGVNKRKMLQGREVTFDPLAAGEYSVTLFGSGGMRNLSAEVKKGEETTLQVSDEGGLKVKAKISYESGEVVEMGQAYLVDMKLKSMSAMAGMSSMKGMGMVQMGNLEIVAQRAGRYRLTVQLHQGAMAGQQKDLGEVEILSQGETNLGNFTIAEGLSMKLFVVDEAGQGVQHAMPTVEKDQMPTSNYHWRTNSDGEATLKGLPEPPFVLYVGKKGYATQRQEVHAVSGSLSVVLSKGFSVRLRLVGGNVGSRFVSLKSEGSSTMLNAFRGMAARKKTDEQGVVEFEHVSSGRYVLLVAPEDNKGKVITTEAFELYEGMGEQSIALP